MDKTFSPLHKKKITGKKWDHLFKHTE